MTRPLAFSLDLVVVLAFVAIGRSAHDETNAVIGLATTAAPFVVALILGWIGVLVLHRDPVMLAEGVGIWLGTWIIGLVLRAVVFAGGTAPAFVVVAGVSLAVGLIGWRAVRALITRRSKK